MAVLPLIVALAGVDTYRFGEFAALPGARPGHGVHRALRLVDNPGGLRGLASLLAFLALVLAVSAALHHLVEKPVERRLRRIRGTGETPGEFSRDPRPD